MWIWGELLTRLRAQRPRTGKVIFLRNYGYLTGAYCPFKNHPEQWFSTLGGNWKFPGSFKQYCSCCPAPSDSELIGLWSDLGFGTLKSSPKPEITELRNNHSEPLLWARGFSIPGNTDLQSAAASGASVSESVCCPGSSDGLPFSS